MVNMLLQSDLPSVEEQIVASGRQVLPLVGVADLKPGDILGVARDPLMRVLLDVLPHDSQAAVSSSDSSAVLSVSAVRASPPAARAAPVSPSPALLQRLNPEQYASFLRVRASLPSHLRAVAFDLHDSDWTPSAI